MKILLPLLVCLPLTACKADDAVPAPGMVWELKKLDGALFSAAATISFPEPGVVAGKAPCNSYRGAQVGTMPAFATEGIAATRRACADLALESAFFQSLDRMRHIAITGKTLTLSDGQGGEMMFTAAPQTE